MTARILSARNPRTGEADYQFSAADEKDISLSATVAREAQACWHARGVQERGHILLRWAMELEQRRDALSEALVADTGRASETDLEIDSTLASLRRWCESAPELLQLPALRPGDTPGISIGAQTIPFELVGIISPWNFPLLLALIDAIPALLAGSAVLIKPSEVTPRFIEPLAESLRAVPELAQVCHCLAGDGATGAAMIPLVDMIVFTGSVATGRRVGAVAAEQFIPAFLELGGKDAAIICADADIERSAAALAWGSMANAGQSCLSIERAYVQRDIERDFLTALQEQFSMLSCNLEAPDSGQIGPIIARSQADIVRDHLEDARQKGAQFLCGGQVIEHNGGLWCEPTLLSHVNHDMKIMTEETFAAVLPVMSFESESEAVHLANATRFGLSGAVFAGTTEHALELAQQLQAGAISVNDCALTAIVHEGEKQSFKDSGLGGSRMGAASIQRFLRKQALLVNSEQCWDPWWFSPNRGKQ